MKIRPFFSLVRVHCTHLVLLLALTLSLQSSVQAQTTVPFTLSNNSAYADANVYVAVVGIINDNHVWINPKTGAVNLMSVSNNTVQGPVINGNQGPGGNGRYANCFARLSEIPNKTINIPGIAGCRILISFNSQLFLYFFGASGAPSGYAAPDLANPSDPNQGIRFENIELTNAANGLWANTTRVDGYQYPMGLEVWGNGGFYKKVGEFIPHSQILSLWQSTAPADFAGCYDATNTIIKFPSKTPAFQSGAQANYFGSYVDAIWSKYQNGNLVFNAGDAGTWSGRVSGNVFTFTRASDGQIGTISRKPTNIEVMEGSGVMATGGQWDKVVQAQICAAINRHAIDLNLATGVTQDLATASKYYQTSPYNWYCKFWHRSDISLNSLTYAFCYDDVYDHSSTVNASSPIRATITIGGYAGQTQTGPVTVYKDCNYAGYAVNLSTGTYTLSQLNALGILNDDISSLKVTSGYKVTLYKHDNFGGATLTVTADNACLVTNNWNDSTSSLKVETNSAFSTVIQAESYTYMAGVDVEATTDAGGGQNVGWIDAGDWMSYDINIPAAGTYRFDYRVASPNSNTTLRLEKDGGATQLGSVTIPNTGGWQTWGNASHTVTLPAGAYSIGVATGTGGFNLNYFTITSVSSARLAMQNTKLVEDNIVSLTPNPVHDQLYIRGNDQVKTLGIYDISGRAVMNVKSPGNTIAISHLAPGVYIIAIERKDGTKKNVKILKQ
ncbi:beta-1,3-glucanase family protein [Chitinophaga pinensis]|uniref:Carbohydrate-binding protein n=1 Tax=Chitinophaga pinensis TaxID=79329 RepID=A0A5C6LLW2_9BACT|nr:beta-1,3-glucanase family protein [Chitinophaga pinensis]TWV95118.1 carbohydrate-binding protein [Chitinophaga pinensis]